MDVRQWWTLLVSIAAISALTTASSGFAAAGEPRPERCTNPGNYFDGGYTTWQIGLFAARATIDRDNPYICDNSSSSSAWALLAPSNTKHHAQAGLGGFPGTDSAIRTFYEWTRACRGEPDCPTGGIVRDYSPAPDGPVRYSVHWRPGDGKVHMYAGGTHLAETAYATSNVWESAWSAQFAGETWHHETDVPGTKGNKVRFQDVQRYEANGDINYVQNVTWIRSRTKFHHERIPDSPGVDFRIWTDPI